MHISVTANGNQSMQDATKITTTLKTKTKNKQTKNKKTKVKQCTGTLTSRRLKDITALYFSIVWFVVNYFISWLLIISISLGKVKYFEHNFIFVEDGAR